ncbi:MAG: hypothetical protein LBB45_03500 [Methanobrevibacter sp.]|nr:hypothetical protein [Candidatus Methanovirga basalitermitum]
MKISEQIRSNYDVNLSKQTILNFYSKTADSNLKKLEKKTIRYDKDDLSGFIAIEGVQCSSKFSMMKIK